VALRRAERRLNEGRPKTFSGAFRRSPTPASARLMLLERLAQKRICPYVHAAGPGPIFGLTNSEWAGKPTAELAPVGVVAQADRRSDASTAHQGLVLRVLSFALQLTA
jgi:hypothetical protein